MSDGSLVCLDALSYIKPPATSPSSGASDDAQRGLKALYDLVQTSLQAEGASADVLVIVDDLSTLEWIGIPSLELTRFVRALHASCLQVTPPLFVSPLSQLIYRMGRHAQPSLSDTIC